MCVGARFWDPGILKLEPSEATHTHAQRRGRAFAVTARSKEVLFLPESYPATPYNVVSLLLSLRLRSPKYLALLLTLKSDRLR